jgi:hypothetical protein
VVVFGDLPLSAEDVVLVWNNVELNAGPYLENMSTVAGL